MAKKVNKKKAFKLRLKRQGLFKGPQAPVPPVPPVAPTAPQPPVKPEAAVETSEIQVAETANKETANQALSLEDFVALPELAGIRANLVEALYNEGLTSAAAFETVTEKEVLALKGVGPATVKKLKENGVSFKD